MTADDAVAIARSRVDHWLTPYSGPSSVLYRRMGLRQRQLFQRVSQINEEYFGTCATAPLSNGVADLRDVADPVPEPAAIQRVTIADIGTSTYVTGTVVSIVPLADAASAIPPRMTLRDGLLAGVGSEMLLVASITISYAKMPAMLLATSGSTELEVPSPYDDLLVLDLGQFMATHSSADPAAKATAIAALAAEETSLLDDFFRSVANYAPLAARFSRPPSGVTTLATK